jgi:hypothetical protein
MSDTEILDWVEKHGPMLLFGNRQWYCTLPGETGPLPRPGKLRDVVVQAMGRYEPEAEDDDSAATASKRSRQAGNRFDTRDEIAVGGAGMGVAE